MDIAIATKVKQAVVDYERQNPDEFIAYKAQKKGLQDLMANEFAAATGDHVAQRELFTLPETLSNMIKMKLTDEEYQQIWGQDPTCSGALWFAKTFPQYRSGRKY